VEDEGIALMLTTPQSIRTLQRKLYRKAKQEPAFRFYALYDKVYRADILGHAYRLVRANKGVAGVDGVSFSAIESAEGQTAFIAELQEALKSKSYTPEPVRRVMIPKTGGSKRALGIPTIRDRVVQMAAKLVIEPIFEADFCDCSYGFRPKRSAHDAVNDVTYALNCGYTEVIDADVAKYFDTIPHAKLLAAVAERIADGSILHLIKMWLKAPVVGESEDGTRYNIGGGKANTKGTPQGGVISPLLANLYLHLLDRVWERSHLQKRLEARLVRYADDILVMCRKDTHRPLAVMQRVCDRLGLCLNEHKTRMVNAKQESFDFLGFAFRMRTSHNTGNLYPHVQPAEKSLKKIKAQVTMLSDRRLTMLPLPVVMQRINEALRGWVGYFHYRNSSKTLEQLKRHVEQRVRIHLNKRYKFKGREYNKFTNQLLYQRYGLYKVPTTAGCTRAHALR